VDEQRLSERRLHLMDDERVLRDARRWDMNRWCAWCERHDGPLEQVSVLSTQVPLAGESKEFLADDGAPGRPSH